MHVHAIRKWPVFNKKYAASPLFGWRWEGNKDVAIFSTHATEQNASLGAWLTVNLSWLKYKLICNINHRKLELRNCNPTHLSSSNNNQNQHFRGCKPPASPNMGVCNPHSLLLVYQLSRSNNLGEKQLTAYFCDTEGCSPYYNPGNWGFNCWSQHCSNYAGRDSSEGAWHTHFSQWIVEGSRCIRRTWGSAISLVQTRKPVPMLEGWGEDACWQLPLSKWGMTSADSPLHARL